MAVTLVTAAQRPDLVASAEAMTATLWPDYLVTQAMQACWPALYSAELAAFQSFALMDDTIVGVGNAVPFFWPLAHNPQSADLPETGWDGVLEAGIKGVRHGIAPNTLSALAVAIRPDHRGTGLAETLLGAMADAARGAGLSAMVAPVRPTRKADYPLHDFATYCAWQREDGLPFDPWLRTHVRLGARFLAVAPRSMTVTAPLSEWTEWTGLRFPVPGRYWAPGMLAPLVVEGNTGTYHEPNFWMRHPL